MKNVLHALRLPRSSAHVCLFCLSFLLACSREVVESPTPQLTPTFTPEPTPYAGPVTDQQEYMRACEAELGEFPPFNCYEGVQIPITVTDSSGTRFVTREQDLEEGQKCDRPSRLSGCVPYSYVGVKTNSRGSLFTFICRLYEFRAPIGTTSDGRPLVMFEDLGVIGHNPRSGASCFWAVPIDGKLFDGTQIPRPGSDEDASFYPERGFWYTLPALAGSGCTTCHDNDPYVQTPWVQQVKVVPSVPLTSYHSVAADQLNALAQVTDWSPAQRLKEPDAAPCLSCHRLSNRFTCASLVEDATGDKLRIMPTTAHFSQYPYSHWMDSFDAAELQKRYPTEADWDAQYAAATRAIQQCCLDKSSTSCWE